MYQVLFHAKRRQQQASQLKCLLTHSPPSALSICVSEEGRSCRTAWHMYTPCDIWDIFIPKVICYLSEIQIQLGVLYFIRQL